ncbi:MAG: glycosyltransferase [Defluviitaleaceae bacterium]|nr:glycosyltransferase [Defluviitaleaceae bacterium]
MKKQLLNQLQGEDTPKKTLKVVHIINYAGNGGSEKYIKILGGDFLIYNIAGPLTSHFNCTNIKMRHPLDLKAAKQIAKFCKKNSINIVHTHFARENYIAILSKLFGNKVKVVYTSHINLKNNLPWKILNKIFTRHNHAVIAVCNSVKELLIQNGYKKDKIKIIYNGATSVELKLIEDNQFDKGYSYLSIPQVVTLARLSEEKGLFFLCDIAKEMPNIQFIIAGEGVLENELKKYAPSNVSFPGHIKASEVLEKASLYINTSTSEALSFGILEALGYGIPIIAANVGGNIDIIRESNAGKLIEPGNAKDALEKIKHVLENRAEYSKNALHAINTIFSEEEMKRKTYEVYYLH